MSRLLDGFNYFWNKKPSQWKTIDTVWLHQWMKLLKSTTGKGEDEQLSEDDMETMVRELFG